jgi:protein tyrosine/serine phosphatase
VDRLKRAREAFETMAYPALMHCKSGADRAGFMAVFYLHLIEGRPLDEAFHQLDPKYLHMKQGKTGILDAFWVLWGEAMAAGATDFWTWLETDYDEAALKRNFRPSLFGDIVVDGLLRRE